MRLLAMFALGAVTALVALPVRAQTCAVPEGATPSLASVEATRRLAFVTGALGEAGEKSDQWGSFWRTTFQGAAVVQFALAGVSKKEADRIDAIAGGTKSMVGAVFAYVARLPAERHHPAWAEHPWEQGDTCTRLAAAEAQLEKDALIEGKARSFGMHALGWSFNLGVGVAAYLMHHRLWSVLSATVIGGMVGETRIWTTPTVATEALARYRTGALEAPAKVSFSPLFVPQPGGGHVMLAVTF